MKHIEQILPEYAASEIDRMLVGDDDATATAALTRLLHDWTGCDIPQTSDLPESEVEELVPLCVSILRRHWQTPLTCLGDGTTPMSLSDLMRQAIGDRVQGNEALGIPPANANIPTAVAALRDRKIDAGFDECPDGISLMQLLGSSNSANVPTKIIDTNKGWAFDREIRVFPNVKELHIGAGSVASGNVRLITKSDLELHLDELTTSNNDGVYYAMFTVAKLYLNAYKYGIFRIGGHASYTNATTKYIYVGCKGKRTDHIRLNNYCYQGGCVLEKVELRQGARQRFTLDCPSFQVADPYVNMTAENIVSGILEPLADNTYEDDGVTLAAPITISIGSANIEKLSNEQIAIATNKNYTLA